MRRFSMEGDNPDRFRFRTDEKEMERRWKVTREAIDVYKRQDLYWNRSYQREGSLYSLVAVYGGRRPAARTGNLCCNWSYNRLQLSGENA